MKTAISFLLCLMLALLAGCAPKGQPLLPQSEADSRWQTFAQRSAVPAESSILSGSLRFGTDKSTQRLVYLMWADEGGYPDNCASAERRIRLDVGTSAEPVLGSLLFDEQGRMLLLLPQERKAYTGEASKRNLRRLLGLPLPFDMQGLYAFLSGDIHAALDAPQPERYEIGNDDNIVYRWRKGASVCELELSPQALPTRWNDSNGWDMEISCGNDGLPAKLSGRMTSGEEVLRLVLLVKERRPVSRGQAPSLSLAVPAGFDVHSID